jgi:hypothetical protein
MSRRTGVVLTALLCLVLAAPATAAKQTKPLKFTGGKTTLALAPGTADALASLGVSVSPLKPARAGEAGIAFPITTGHADAKTLAGAIRHSGGLRLAKGDTVVDLRRFTIRLDDAPDLTAAIGSSRVSILDLDLSDAKIGASKRRVTVSGVKATLTKAAADALNSAFGTTAFTEGLEIGTANVSARRAPRK